MRKSGIGKRLQKYARDHKRRRNWRSLVSVMAAAVVFCTTYSLILPAITLEGKTCCGLEEHAHAEEGGCYERVLTCTQASGHTHSQACYEEQAVLICTLPEGADPGHTHGDGCYERQSVPVCGQEESLHQHGDECYAASVTCEKAEHTHATACFSDPEAEVQTGETAKPADHPAEAPDIQTPETAAPTPLCGKQPHTHDETCLDAEGNPICGLEAHAHSLACDSDPTADLETAEIWEATLPAERTNEYRQDLLAVAKSQLGYQESAKNYEVVTDPNTGAEEKKGCTRYGQWYGQTLGADPLAYAYRDWDALFVSFCLHYAGIPEEELPRAAAAAEWVALLENGTADEMSVTAALGGGFLPAAAYTGAEIGGPWEGDLVFFDENADGTADRMGLVSGRTFAEDGYTMTGFQVIRGDTHSEALGADAVAESFCALDDPTLLGFARLPGQQEEDPVPLATTPATVVKDGNGNLTYTPPVYTYHLRRYDNGITGSTEGEFKSGPNVFLIYPTANDGDRLKELPKEEDEAYAIITLDSIEFTSPTNKCRAYLGATPVADVIRSNSSTGTKGITFNAYAKDIFNEAELWHFKKTAEGNYKIYTKTSDSAKQYLKMTKNTDRYAHLELTTDDTEASCFILTQKNTGAIEFMIEVQFQDAEQTFNAVETVSPSNTKINVFDYWVGTQETDDNNENNDAKDGGINQGKNLKFRRRSGSLGDNLADCNKYYESGAYQGIVKNTLGNDGYPVLADGSNQSLAYLFDPTSADAVAQNYRQTIQNAQGLLRQEDGYFVYDCKQNYAYLQKDENGKYTNQFAVYSPEQDRGVVGDQFYPFNPLYWESPGANAGDTPVQHGLLIGDTTAQSQMNHYFGLTLTARFIQQNGGQTSASGDKDTIFEFSGDDDIWIFIDDVLVADLGGIHGVVNVTINFKDGTVMVDPISHPAEPSATTLKQAYEKAGKPNATNWSDTNTNTFADGTVHTLKFFYLERGNGASNMTLRYNLIDQNASAIYKVDQDGHPVPGAEFEVYKATKDPDGNYTRINPKKADYTGTTNSDGVMYFTNPTTGAIYSMADLKKEFGEYIILKETGVPPGYRTVADEAWLHLDTCIFCENVYQSGVWAKNNALVSVDQTTPLKVADAYKNTAKGIAGSVVTGTEADGYTIAYVNSTETMTSTNGTLFAVAMKKNSGDASNIDTWTPVYGSNTNGYHLVTEKTSNVENAILAAQKQAALTGSGGVVFTLSEAKPQLLMENLPGKVSSYEGVTSDPAQVDYDVAYFWTPGSLANASSTNTLRVEPSNTGSNKTITATWGTTVEVPNMENRLFFQKLNLQGDLVNGATFALYPARDAPSGHDLGTNYVYYKCAETDIYAALTSASGNTGDAVVFKVPDVGTASKSGSGTYSIDPTTGRITVTVTKDGSDQPTNAAYHVEPATNARRETLVGTTHDVCDFISKPGTGHFTKLTNGEYYLREIAAPPGFQLNTTDIPVLVNQHGVYAYAGGENEPDDVSVGSGVGYVTKTLNVFATPKGIDRTLAWVKGELLRNTATGFTAFDGSSGSADNWHPVNDQVTYLEYNGSLAGNAGTETVFDYTSNTQKTEHPNNELRLFTDYGWSNMAIYQDHEFGETHKDSSTYDKLTTGNSSNLFSSNGNISNLFSASTFVRVADMKIEKYVQEDTDVAEASQKWKTTNDADIGQRVDFLAVIQKREKSFTFKAKMDPGLVPDGTTIDVAADSKITVAEGTATLPYRPNATVVLMQKTRENGTLTEQFGVQTGGRWTWTSDISKATEFTANTNGEIALSGLSAGEYYLRENIPVTNSVTATTEADGHTVLEYTFVPTDFNGIPDSAEIVIHYHGKLDGNAEAGKQYVDAFSVVYGGKNTTEEIKTTTSTWALPIYKYTGSGETKTPLANAEFTLKDANGNVVKLEKTDADYAVNPNGAKEKVVSGANGKIEIRGLDSGRYTLTETKAPDGYRPLTESITIDIGNDGKINATDEKPQGDTEVEVRNDPGYELPETGGTGTALFTICGLLMMAAAAGCGYGLRRGQERRARLKGISE